MDSIQAHAPATVNAGRIVFLFGPSGAGKSTTARHVAARMPALCALLDFDAVRHLIKAGYAEPAYAWDAAAECQWETAKQVIQGMASTYCQQGVNVVIEVFATPHDYPFWQTLVAGVPFKAFVLLPPVEVALERNARRSGAARLKDSDIRQNHEWSMAWLDIQDVTVLDSSASTPEAIAVEIVAAMN